MEGDSMDILETAYLLQLKEYLEIFLKEKYNASKI